MIQRKAGIDLGAANFRASLTGAGLIMKEPAAAAVDRTTGQMLYYGAKAENIFEALPPNVTLFRPFRNGLLDDLELTHKVIGGIFRDHLQGVQHVLLSVPCSITDVEEGALTEIMGQIGILYPHTVYSPIAALAGSGLGITDYVLSVDIGASSTDIALVCNGEIIYLKSVPSAGESFDLAIAKYLLKERGIKVTLRTAESVKMTVGTVWNEGKHREVQVSGISALNPDSTISLSVHSDEMLQALEEPTAAILEAICVAISHIPTKYVPRVFENGILLTGGTVMLDGLDKMISGVTGVKTMKAYNSVTACISGTETILNYVGNRGISSVCNLSAFYLTKCRANQ